MIKSRISLTRGFRSLLTVLTAGFVISSCTSMPPIATDVSYCCEPGTAGIHSFRVEFKDMPEFLKPMLRDSASVVLDSKGVEYTEGDADATMLLAFVHVPLSSQAIAQDPMSESLSQGGDSRFVAEVHMELSNNITGDLIRSGTMSRIHNVTVGSYMHEEPARDAMHQAFMDMFADYPNPGIDGL